MTEVSESEIRTAMSAARGGGETASAPLPEMLTACPICDGKLSDRAPACVHCGSPRSGNAARAFIDFLFVVWLVVFLAVFGVLAVWGYDGPSSRFGSDYELRRAIAVRVYLTDLGTVIGVWAAGCVGLLSCRWLAGR